MRSAAASLRDGIKLRGGRKKPGGQPVEHSLALTATMCLVAFGVVMVFSASSTASLLGETGDGFFYLKRTLMFGVIGLVALRLLSVHGLETVRRLTPAFLAVCFGLLLVTLVPGVGSSANGAQRWIAAGPIQIQASELAKIALILYGADLLARRPGMVKDLYSLRPYLILVAAVCILVVIQPDLGTAMVAAFSVGALLIAAGVKLRHLALVVAVLAFFALVSVIIEPYRQERIFSFLSPGADASGAGYQGSQATVALGSGGIFGVGLGESVQKAFYLPEAHTDMIAAVVGEEIGLVGLGGMVTLYMLLGYAGFRTAQRAKDRYGRLLAAGLTSMIMIQATINLFAVMGMAPLTGVTLPFVSYGNSSLIVTLAAVGILLNIAAGGTAAERRQPAPPRSRSRPKARATGGSRGKRGLQLVDGGAGRPRRQRRRRSG